MPLSKKLVEICESNGWNVNEDRCITLSQHSPAGEDFFFEIEAENDDEFVDCVEQYADEFDPDEHAEMWVELRGKRGVPKSIRILIDDADAIQDMISRLSDALQEAVYG